MNSNLTIENLSVHRRGRALLDSVSLEVGFGELVAILGPSGAGKSTLLRAISGLVRPSSGTVRVGDRDVTKLPPQGRNVAMVMDDPALFSHMSVEENIAFAANRELGDSTPKEQVLVAETILNIHDLARRYPGELSMGQRQKVSLARALVRRPQVLLFDEPLAHVDAYAGMQLREEILRVHHRMNAASLYVTHDVKEAFSIADRIIYMQEGAILQDELPQEVHDGPATVSIARHLGATTLISTRARVEHLPTGEVVAHARVLSQDLDIAASPDVAPGANTPIVIVGYPDSVDVSPAEAENTRFNVRADMGQVLSSTYLGESYRLRIETELGAISADVSPDCYEELASDTLHVRLRDDLLWALPAPNATFA